MNSMANRLLYSALTLSLFIGYAGCEAGHGHEGELDDEICEHMTGGPAISVVAVSAGEAGAPDVNTAHHRYDIGLPGTESTAVDVAFPSSAAAEYQIALDRDIPFQVIDSGGNIVAVEESLRSGLDCATLAVIHVVDMGISTYRFRFGPTLEPEVRMVVEAAGSHDHEQ